MKITICGHKIASTLVKEYPNQLDVLMISSPGHYFGISNSELIPKLAKECKQLGCDDMEFDPEKYPSVLYMGFPPAKEHVQEGLDWAKGRERIVVACQAGVSRSSAMAYVIMCSLKSPQEALSILEHGVHFPNDLIIKHGSRILGKPEMIDIVNKWKYGE